VAARAEDALAVLSAVARVPLANGTGMPQMRAGDAAGAVAGAKGSVSGAAGRATVVAALRKALEAVCARTRDVTLVVPDAAVRVLLLDFDALPAKATEALPVVRFRLKKLLPFDAEDAAVSYQVMATTRDALQVVAVAMPREVQAEYESMVREAGFEPGAILPSTLAALAGLGDGDRPMLVVNAGRDAVTTAIVKGGVLLLHRTVDLGGGVVVAPAGEDRAQVNPADTSIAAIAARLAEAQAPVREPEAVAKTADAAGANEVGQAVSVAAAYFEDTLETAPAVLLSAGTLGAEALTRLIDEAYFGIGPVAVQELLDRQMLNSGTVPAGEAVIPLGWLAGVRGALAN
jgi:type IV pilus assembly protein PilM